MGNYVILDTCIYRELGLKFNENIDYKNLHAFTLNTDGEVLLSEIVIEEFSNYYKSTLLLKTNAYIKASKDITRDPFFKTLETVKEDINSDIESAIKLFRKTLKNDPIDDIGITILASSKISGLRLAKFILESKETKESNVQVRDYLIWDSVLFFAVNNSQNIIVKPDRVKITHEKSLVTFISKDKGFEDNMLFKNLVESYGIDNVEIRKSIPEFLEKKGFYFDFITKVLIKEKITPKRILSDLNKDISALLSYVSVRYQNNCDESAVEESEIEKIEVLEHYTYIDSRDGKHKFTANLKVWVRVVFEKDEEGYEESLAMIEKDYGDLETYDEYKRPFYQKPLLMFYGGLVNVERKSIRSIKFIDYMPDRYLYEKYV